MENKEIEMVEEIRKYILGLTVAGGNSSQIISSILWKLDKLNNKKK